MRCTSLSVLSLLSLAAVSSAMPSNPAVDRLMRRQFGTQRGQGQAGQTGQKGQTGQAGQTGQTGKGAQTGQTGQTGQAGKAGQTGGNANNGTAAAGGASKGGDIQSSLQLDPSQVQPGLANNGQDNATAGQVPSLTSVNNFINFCATQQGVPLTNGQQVQGGSCNPTPMGRIVAKNLCPTSKFSNPVNFQAIKENTAFTVNMNVKNLQTGSFTNADETYFAAPAQVNGQGVLIGHTHVTIEKVASFTDTNPTDPTRFAFFKGINGAAQGGVVTADVTNGLPAGTYRMSSINSAANHQSALCAVAQRGAIDDVVYFEVTADGQPSGAAAGGAAAGGNNGGKGAAAANSTTTAAATGSTTAAGGKGATNGQTGKGAAGAGAAAAGQAGKGAAAAGGAAAGQAAGQAGKGAAAAGGAAAGQAAGQAGKGAAAGGAAAGQAGKGAAAGQAQQGQQGRNRFGGRNRFVRSRF